MHASLSDGEATPGRPGQNLRVDQCAAASQFHAVKHPSFIEFEGAVDVFDFQMEDAAHKACPAPGIESSDQALLPIKAEATDDVILLYQWKQGR